MEISTSENEVRVIKNVVALSGNPSGKSPDEIGAVSATVLATGGVSPGQVTSALTSLAKKGLVTLLGKGKDKTVSLTKDGYTLYTHLVPPAKGETTNRRRVAEAFQEIELVVDDNPRRKGTATYSRFAELLKAYRSGHKEVKYLLEHTPYNTTDLRYDIKHNIVKAR
jgi:DNA-binding PadR family transcriptional regulator